MVELTLENKLKRIIVVGDKVLIRPKQQNEKTKSSLYLPPGVHEKEKVLRKLYCIVKNILLSHRAQF